MLLGRVLLAAWELVRPVLVLALNVIVALILLFEEWGWRPLSALVARLARFRLWAMAELWIAGLPPYGALLTLAVPSVILIPAKLLGVYLLATGHFVTAGSDHRRCQVRLDGAHRPHLPAHQAGTDADPVVRVCLRRLRALAGGAVRAHPRVMAVALWPHHQVARRSNYVRTVLDSRCVRASKRSGAN